MFDLTARLPDQVFRQRPIRYRFGEFDMVFSERFWYALRRLAAASGDPSIHVAVIDPPDAFYDDLDLATRSEISTKSSDDYLQWLYGTDQIINANSLVYTAEAIVFQPPSAGWGIWAQRNMEIAVLAVFDDVVDKSGDPEPIRWFSASEALHDLVALRYPNQTVPSSLSATLLENYG